MNIDSLEELYESYYAKALKVEQDRKPGEGIFGIGKKPADDPCHDRFVADLKDWLETFSETEPDSAAVREVLSLIYMAPKKYPEPKSAYWMLVAVQGLTIDLIPRLTAEDAAALDAEFSTAYKRWERLPAQKQILDELNRMAK